jgi:outer membrane protein TolC
MSKGGSFQSGTSGLLRTCLAVLIALAVHGYTLAGEVAVYAVPNLQLTRPAQTTRLTGAGSEQAPIPQPFAASIPSQEGPLFGRIPELTVEALVQQVLARNPSLAQMTAAWRAAEARYPQVTSLEDPMFMAMVAPASFGSNTVEPGYRVEVSQKYPFPGKLNLRGEGALAEARAAGGDVEDMRLQLVESARGALSDYFLVERAIDVNRKGLELLQKFRENIQSRYEKTLAPQQEVFLADVEIGRQRDRGLTLQRMRQVAVARINTLLHLPPDQPLPPAPRQLALGAALPPVQVLRDLALTRRPDLQALAARLAAENAALALALRDYCPDFEAVAAYDTMMGNGPMRDLAPQVGIRVNLPFRRTRRGAAVAEAQAKIAQRRAELDARADQVNFQVQEAYAQVLESEKLVRLYQATILPAAQKNVDAAQSAYTAGKIPALNLIDAQRTQVNLLDRLYEATADYFRRRATLERVTGGPLTETTLRH